MQVLCKEIIVSLQAEAYFCMSWNERSMDFVAVEQEGNTTVTVTLKCHVKQASSVAIFQKVGSRISL